MKYKENSILWFFQLWQLKPWCVYLCLLICPGFLKSSQHFVHSKHSPHYPHSEERPGFHPSGIVVLQPPTISMKIKVAFTKVHCITRCFFFSFLFQPCFEEKNCNIFFCLKTNSCLFNNSLCIYSLPVLYVYKILHLEL